MALRLRTDTMRFTDLRYTEAVLRLYLKVDRYPLTPAEEKQLKEEFLAFNEYLKGGLDVLTNISILGVSAYNTIEYYKLVVKTGGSPGAINQILKYTFQLTKEGRLGAQFIDAIARSSGNISSFLTRFKANSSKFLGFLVVIQVGIHAVRGDYPKCLAEIGKTALCGAIPVAAFIDLVDSMLGLIVPQEYLKMPIVRVLRGMNPAQCTFVMVENMCWLLYAAAVGRQKGWTKFNDALDAWASKIESSPLSIYTQLSRDPALLFDEYILPDSFSRFSIFGASIRNLADYARANPTAY
ncbi:MAG: hypothetical protein AB7F88_09565 [Pyrinomonadaceae bacterium]